MKKNDISYRVPGTFEEQRFEKLHNVVFDSPLQASKTVALEIADLIKKDSNGKKCIVGLSTGSSPISVYKELVRLHKDEGLSFKTLLLLTLMNILILMKMISIVIIFTCMNLLIKLTFYIKISTKSNIDNQTMRSYCMKYDKKIMDLGGIDLQLLGIGRTGHIGFNEPGSHINSQTRFVVWITSLVLMLQGLLMELKMFLKELLQWELKQF